MSNLRSLEIEALEELKDYLDGHPQLEPLQRYVQEKLLEAGDDTEQRMNVMMELIRFSLYLELLPEFKQLKSYVSELEGELKHKAAQIYLKDEKKVA